MSTTLTLPTAETASDFLTRLYGVDINATNTDQLPTDQVFVLAQYVDEQDAVQATVSCDLACGAKLGAALTQIPVGGVEDAIEAGVLPENLAENLSEVCNILVSLFAESSHRLVLKDVLFDAAASAAVVDGESTASFTLDIKRYGTGVLAITAV